MVDVVIKEVSHPRVTVTPTRRTLKMPPTYSPRLMGECIKFVNFMADELQYKDISMRGKITVYRNKFNCQLVNSAGDKRQGFSWGADVNEVCSQGE